MSGSATQTLATQQIKTLLEENAAAMRELHATRVFATTPIGRTPDAATMSSDDYYYCTLSAAATTAAPSASVAAEREALIANPEAAALRTELTAVQAEVERLRVELEEAHGRASTIADCTRKQSEMHATLLKAGHDAAIKARDEARAEASRLRRALEQRSAELAAARKQASVQQQTMEAEMGLLATERKSALEELVGRGRAEAAKSAAGVHLGLLQAELRKADDDAAAAVHVERAPATCFASLDMSALRELKQWCEPPLAADNGSGAEEPQEQLAPSVAELLKHRETMLARIARIEEFADGAAQRYAALQEEHEALKRRHGKLQRAWQRANAELDPTR